MLSRDFGVNVRQRDLVTSKRQKHLADALHLRKAGEDQPNRLAHPQVRIHFDFVVANFYIANGYCEEQLAPSCLLLQGFHRTGPQER